MTLTTITTYTSNNHKPSKKIRLLECLFWFFFGIILQWISTFPNRQRELMTITILPQRLHDESMATVANEFDNNKNNINRFKSHVNFIFVIGLEGTGHHLMGSILMDSPLRRYLRDINVEQHRTKIHKLLHVHSNDAEKWKRGYRPKDNNNNNAEIVKGRGLWNMHCNLETGDDGDILSTQHLKAALANELREVEEEVQEAKEEGSKSNKKKQMYYPINTITPKGGFGEVSYPNFGKDCRFLSYPNLDLWYDVCDMAQVNCEHVYLYRDPIATLQSTTINRDFNPTIPYGIHLYMTMLHIIETQLKVHADRTIGCFGFYEANNKTSWWRDVEGIGGWNDYASVGATVSKRGKPRQQKYGDDYETYMENLYKAPSPVNTTSLISDTGFYDLYMIPLQTLHHRVVRICQENRSRRHKQK